MSNSGHSATWVSSCRVISLIVIFLLIMSIPALGGERKSKAELAERKAFIERAFGSHAKQLTKQLTLFPATLKAFGDWDYYYVIGGSIAWKPNSGQNFLSVEVPEGFVTDLASIPRIFWTAHRPEGRYAYAAVVHDYLYWKQNVSREAADLIFKIAMEDSKVDAATINTIYYAVRRFGQSAWDENASLKKAGERRIIKRFPKDFTISWSEWKKQQDVFGEE